MKEGKKGRYVHVPKTEEGKNEYRENVSNLDDDPTVEERLNFHQTSHINALPPEVSSSRKRPVSLSDKISDYISENLFTGIIGIGIAIVLFIGGYLVFDSKAAFFKFETMLTNQGDDIKEIKSTVKENNEKIIANKIKLQGNNIRLQALKEKVEKNDLRVDKLISAK